MINLNGRYYSGLTKAEQDAYNAYKDYAYELNEKLRLGYILGANEKVSVTHLDSLITKYQHSEAVTLYRVACEDCVNGFINESTFCYPAYMSTAFNQAALVDHAVCDENDVVIFELRFPANTFMAPMDDNPDFGQTEHEMLIGRNSVFEVEDERDESNLEEIKRLLRRHSDGVRKIKLYKMNFMCYREC